MSAWQSSIAQISKQENVLGLLVLDDEHLPVVGM